MREPIFILGMARSGTTTMANVLGSHPKIYLVINGSEHWLLENNYLVGLKDSETKSKQIKNLQKKYIDKFILLKRPWKEDCPWFFERHFPNAKYIIMNREYKNISNSWKNNKWACNKTNYQEIYEMRTKKIYSTFKNKLKNVLIVKLEDLISSPKMTLTTIAKHLELKPQFDMSRLNDGKNWHKHLWKKYYKKED